MSFKLACGDCLEVMKRIPDKSVDMVLCDLPYGTTRCAWDSLLPLDALWLQYKRLIREDGAVVLTAAQPFTTVLINSAFDCFRYAWVWNKFFAGNFVQAKRMPLRTHEDVLVFSTNGKTPRYFPQMTKRDAPIKKGGNKQSEAIPIARTENAEAFGKLGKIYDEKHPITILDFSNRGREDRGLHPTQKPIGLMEYLIRTYTNEGDTVLDNCMGSGPTGVACINLKRNFKGIEKDPKYFQIAKERIEAAAIAAEKAAENGVEANSTKGGSGGGSPDTDSSIGGIAGQAQEIGGIGSDPSLNSVGTESPVDEGPTEGLGTGIGGM